MYNGLLLVKKRREVDKSVSEKKKNGASKQTEWNGVDWGWNIWRVIEKVEVGKYTDISTSH